MIKQALIKMKDHKTSTLAMVLSGMSLAAGAYLSAGVFTTLGIACYAIDKHKGHPCNAQFIKECFNRLPKETQEWYLNNYDK